MTLNRVGKYNTISKRQLSNHCQKSDGCYHRRDCRRNRPRHAKDNDDRKTIIIKELKSHLEGLLLKEDKKKEQGDPGAKRGARDRESKARGT